MKEGQKALLIDITLCAGCRDCMAACMEKHGFEADPFEINFAISWITRRRAEVARMEAEGVLELHRVEDGSTEEEVDDVH